MLNEALMQRYHDLESETQSDLVRAEMNAIACNQFGPMLTEICRLRQKLADRKVIERAKGVVMVLHKWNEATAYRRMQSASMSQRIEMVELAKLILEGKRVAL